MNNLFKKIFLSFFILTLCITFTSVSIFGSSFSDLYQEKSKEDVKITTDVVWSNIIADTKTTRPAGYEGGYGTSGAVVAGKWYGQQINVLSIPRIQDIYGNSKYEIITWSIQGDQQWDFAGVTRMAEDFERKNPDYYVIGGINADFYDWHTRNDYPNAGSGCEVQRGDVLRAVYGNWGLIGFKNDLSNDQIIFSSNGTTHKNLISPEFYLDILDVDGNVVKSVQLAGINKATLADNEVSAYFGNLERVYSYKQVLDPETGEYVDELDENGNKIKLYNSYGEHDIKERIYHKPTLAEGKTFYVNKGTKVIYQAADNSYFGYGKINGVDTNTDVLENSFAIVSKNSEVNEALSEGVSIKVRRHLIGEFEGVENAVGCWNYLMNDGEYANFYNDAYLTTRAPRTIYAQKADGTVCLITMDGRQPEKNFYGTNQEEINAVFEELGIVEAYLLDGGGSSTFFVRENNKFVIKNSPSDGNQRSVSNGILVVAKRDKNVVVDKIETTTDSATITLTPKLEGITYLSVKLDGKEYEAVNNVIKIDNLKSNTSYKFNICYSLENGIKSTTDEFTEFTTDKIMPVVTTERCTRDDQNINILLTINDPDKAINLIFITVNGKRTPYALKGDEETVLKVPHDNASIEIPITVQYRQNASKPIAVFDITYSSELPAKKSGCMNGAYVASIIASLSVAFIIIKRK